MSLAAMVAGAPFFFADGEDDGVTLGVSSAPGVKVELGEVAGDSAGVGEGEDLRFFFFFGEGLGEESGPGVGEALFFPGEGDAIGSDFTMGLGLGEDFLLFDGDGDGNGEGDFSGIGDGFDVGDFSVSPFFFRVVELLRCFRGAGVGVGAKIFLILLPNDCSACARWAMPASTAMTRRPAIFLTCRMGAGK
jgi:hypothetical protein